MIQKLINDELLRKQEERKGRERSGKWSPSSFGRCYRYQFWHRKNEPETNPPDLRSLRVFAVGKLFHNFVQGYVDVSQCERRVETEDVLGFADIVTEDSVIDIKSQHSNAFWYMLKSPKYDVDKQKETNILQVMSYAYFLEKKWGHLVFVSKDDLCIAEYKFHIEAWRERVENELTVLRGFWELDDLPPARPRAYNGKEGKYCPYRDKCEELEQAKCGEAEKKKKEPQEKVACGTV